MIMIDELVQLWWAVSARNALILFDIVVFCDRFTMFRFNFNLCVKKKSHAVKSEGWNDLSIQNHFNDTVEFWK